MFFSLLIRDCYQQRDTKTGKFKRICSAESGIIPMFDE